MAVGITFQPQAFIKSGSTGTSTSTGLSRFDVPNRSGPSARVGESKLKFPPSSGVGNFREKVSFKYTAKPDNFISRAEKETPFAISQRTYDINLPRGGKIDEFV